MEFRLPITNIEAENIETRAASCFCGIVFKYFHIYELCFDAEEKDEISIFLGLYGLPDTIPNFDRFIAEIQAIGIQVDIDPIVPIPVEPCECLDVGMEEGKVTECMV